MRNERGGEVILALVGNKTDLTERRQVTLEEGEAMAAKEGLLFSEVSAKAGFNVKALFRKLATALPAGGSDMEKGGKGDSGNSNSNSSNGNSNGSSKSEGGAEASNSPAKSGVVKLGEAGATSGEAASASACGC